MAERPVFEADREVIAACAACGETGITARRLERWRQVGCLPRRVVVHRRGLRGSATVNQGGYGDQVLATAAALRSGLSLRNVPVALFMDGFDIEPDVLKGVYTGLFAAARTIVVKYAEDSGGELDDVLDVADGMTRLSLEYADRTPLARFKRRARELAAKSGKPRRAEAEHLLVAAMSAMCTALWAGVAPTPEGTRTLVRVAGLDVGQDYEAEAQNLGTASFDRLEAVVREAPPEQWLDARRGVDLMYRFVRARRVFEELTLPPEERLSGLELLLAGDAPFLRGCLIPHHLLLMRDGVDLVPFEQAAARTEAMSRLALALPEEFRPYLPEQKELELAQMTDAFRVRFMDTVRGWAAANPADARALGWVPSAALEVA
jgi:hypothetical protein